MIKQQNAQEKPVFMSSRNDTVNFRIRLLDKQVRKECIKKKKSTDS